MLRRTVVSALFTLVAGQALALYDPAPDAALAAVQGEWQGTLTYLDYSASDRLVTLPTRLFVALGAPNELVLHFVFDDGPSKTVYSYERMTFDFPAKQVSWASGADKKPAESYRITANSTEESATRVQFERSEDGGTARYSLTLSPGQLILTKEEVSPAGEATFRNRYELARPGG